MIALYHKPPCPGIFDTLQTWFSWSPFYHASWIEWGGDFSEYESKALAGGVVHPAHWGANAKPGAVIYLYDFIEPLNAAEHSALIAFLKSELGCGYDYRGICAFLIHALGPASNRWFCSELIFGACQAAGRTLLNDRQPYQVTPGMIDTSTVIDCVGQVVVGGPDIIRPIPQAAHTFPPACDILKPA